MELLVYSHEFFFHFKIDQVELLALGAALRQAICWWMRRQPS